MNPRNEEQLERFAREALEGLPDHRAPASLEQRVRSAIAAQEASPWWQRPESAWPVAARVVLAVYCAGALVALCWIGVLASERLNHFEFWPAAASAVREGLRDLSELGAAFEAIPHLWIVASLGIVGVFTVTLFGLGAALVRLFQPR